MFRRILTTLSLLVFAMAVAGCPPQKESASQGTPSPSDQSSVQSGEYTVRIIFDGLVTFWTPNRSNAPDRLWVLVGNATQPLLLDVGKGMAPHENHLLIEEREDVRVWGRQMESGVAIQHPPLGGHWRRTRLANEDISLKGKISPSLTIVRGATRLLQPCIPGTDRDCTEEMAMQQRKDYEWTVDIDEALAKLPARDPGVKKLRGCLVTEPFNCPAMNSLPLLSARLKLTQGQVFSHELHTEDTNRFTLYNFGPNFTHIQPRAMAREVAVDLSVKGPFEIHSEPLKGDVKQDSIFIETDPGNVVTVRLGNHPRCHPCTDKIVDFLFNFNLLENPLFINQDKLPVPLEFDGGGNFDGQCSPGKYTGGGGS